MDHYDSRFGVFIAGNRKRWPDYPCVSRFRQRRLISFLLRQELFHTYGALVCESDAFMDKDHLTEHVRAGRWDEAIRYLSRFLPSDRLLGLDGRTLLHFLRVHKAIDDIVSGAAESEAVSWALKKCFTLDVVRKSAVTKLRAMLWSLLCSAGLRDSLDLGRVRGKAASIIVDLVWRTPELKEHMTNARGPMKPQNVLPVGFGFRPRRHVKRGPIPGSVLVRHYLHKRRMLPSSTSSHCEGLSFESLIKAKKWMVDLVDTSLEAGKRHQGFSLQSVCKKGAPVGPASQTNLGTFRSPVRHFGMSSDTDRDSLVLKAKEWAVYLTDERLEAWPDLSQGYPFQSIRKDGFPVAQVSQTIPDTLTRAAESSAISSVTKADAPSLLQVFHSLKDPARDYGISPVTNAGAIPSQATSAIWPYPYEHSLISTVTNAGALTPETMSAIWASPPENSRISTVKNAGVDD